MMSRWFNAKKAAQVAHFFCRKEGGEIDVLKLVKLIYLADRQHMAQHGFPIINDRFVSMPHGPVNSITLNHIGGNIQSEIWSEYISDRANYKVAARRKDKDESLGELSAAELESMKQVWAQFGKFDKWQLRDWTHDNCPEWEDPNGSSEGLPHERV